MKLKLTSAVFTAAILLAACEGDTGPKGMTGASGSNGADGSNGNKSLVVQTRLAVGDANCPAGGIRVDSGLDTDNSNVLETGEITSTEYVCTTGRTELTSAELRTSLGNSYFVSGQNQMKKTADAVAAIRNTKGSAKNVILFVGDGMGVSTVTASRIFEGQKKGGTGEENVLSFEAFPFTGLSKTYSSNQQTPDSAPTMTAMVAGVKTNDGVVGLDDGVVRGDCSTTAGHELVTALELAELAGMSTGIVSTARITHATPAATYAKSVERNWEDDGDQSTPAAKACEDIASQLVNFETNLEKRFPSYASTINGVEVVMGGGRRSFLPKVAADNSNDAVSGTEGDRTDGRNLVAEWATAYPTGLVSFGTASFAGGGATPAAVDFNAVNTETTDRLFGLFNESHMQYEADRGNDIAGEPSIADMTKKAIGILDNNNKGFFLMVEGGRIDHAHHAGNAFGALSDTVALADAVKAAYDATDPNETLILVTADHSHVFTIAGYPKRGNPILGKVVTVGASAPSLADDGLPYTTLGYTNGLGFANYGAATDSDIRYNDPADAGRKDLTTVDTTTPGFHQEALIPLGDSETHAGEDVGIYAAGPGAHLVAGTIEQNTIFHVINYAADLEGRAE